jgi:hypothetical protein
MLLITETTEKQAVRLDQKRTGRVVVGALGLLIAIGYLVEAINMPAGTMEAPGPGLFPIGVGIAGIVISALVVIEALVSTQVSGSLELPSGPQRKLVLYFLVTLILLVVLLPILGQYVASSLYAIAVIKLMSKLNWIRVVIYGVLLGCGISAMFIEGFSIRMPQGIW